MSFPLEEINEKYELLRKLGEGGMGAVYKVRHRLLEEVRVIKIVRAQHADDPELRERFQREARTAIRLRHPSIAQLYDFSISKEGVAYIVMEHIEGMTLQQLLAERGALELGLAMELAAQALDALGYLHQQGYLHRDVAADNLMVTRGPDGEPRVKLIDLGIAKRLDARSDLTATGMFVGKIRYTSPEQLGGEALDARSDLYSFGVMLYEMLTGRFPIEGEEFSQLIAGHLFRPPVDFSISDPEGRIPDELRQVVLRAIAKKPDDRFASAEELARGLEPFRSARKEPEPEAPVLAETTRMPAPAVPASTPVASPSPRSSTVAEWLPPGGSQARWLRWAAAPVLAVALAGGGWWLARGPGDVAEPALSPGDPEAPPAVVGTPYEQALAEIADQRWQPAVPLLRQALAEDAEEKPATGGDGAYLPHFYLGRALYGVGNAVAALDAWRESERQGVVQTTPQHEQLLALRAECERLVTEPAIARAETELVLTEQKAGLFEEMIDDPDLAATWATSPQLERSARAVLSDLRAARQEFERARTSKELGAILDAEIKARDLKDELQALEKELGELLGAASAGG